MTYPYLNDLSLSPLTYKHFGTRFVDLCPSCLAQTSVKDIHDVLGLVGPVPHLNSWCSVNGCFENALYTFNLIPMTYSEYLIHLEKYRIPYD